jgi:signal transduction histidine kinase
MKLTKQLEAAILDVYEAYWGSLFNVDMETYAAVLDKDFKLIGTTEAEVFFKKIEAIRFLKATADQLAGNIELRNREIKVEPVDELMLITEQSDAYVNIDTVWTFYAKVRSSAFLQKKNDSWKFIQMHISLPDTMAEEGETIALEQVKTENLQLREAVKRRTVELEHSNKELKIESALERVRTVAMAMQQPEVMLDICQIISTELENLGVTNIRNIQTGIIDASKESYLNYEYFRLQKKKLVTVVEYKKHKEVHAFVKKMMKGPESFFTTQFKGVPLKQYIQYMIKAGQFVDPATKKTASLHYYFYSIGPGALGISSYAPLTKEAIALFKRFRNVFQLAYRRFLDIEKAIAQAKEAQMELALERVRARAMAMQKSDELREVVMTIYEQLQHLNFNAQACNIVIADKVTGDREFWVAGFTKEMFPESYKVPYINHPYVNQQLGAWKHGEKYAVFEYTGKMKKDFDKIFFSATDFRNIPDDAKRMMIELPSVTFSTAFFNYGSLQALGKEALSTENADILKRFAKVFEQTYTRFLDLQKAEAQTRKAQIEAAVERVRAQSMAMHRTSDLTKVNEELLTQLNRLSIAGLTGVTLYLVDEEGIVKVWDLSSPGNIGDANSYAFKYDYKIYPTLGEFVGIWKAAKQEYFILDFPKEKLLRAVEELQQVQPEVAQQFRAAIESGALQHQWNPAGRLTNGILSIDLMQPPIEDTKNIVLKMAGAFNMAYQRFLDLQKAEAQAKEAKIEAALERVRSRSMAMHKSEELKDVIQVVYEQFIQLNINIEHTGFIIDYKERNDMHIWLADMYASPFEITIPYFDSPHWNSFINAKKKGENFFTNLLNVEEKNKFYQDLFQLIPPLPEEARQTIFSKPGLAISTVLLDDVGLYIENFSAIPFTDEENTTLMRFGKVFQQTYTRFLDLQKAEAQTREGQIQLAMERVRARTMAMQRSDELPDAATILFQQIQALGMPAWSAGYCIWNDDKSAVTLWMSSEGVLQPPFTAPTTEDELFIEMRKGQQAGKTFHVVEMGEKKLVKHYKYMRTLPVVGEILDSIVNAGHPLPTFQIMHHAYFTHGFLLFITYEAVPDAHDIFKRFGKVFDQTYTRFLDLQKAEAQAREAQIELGLERVRARAMAMQNSDELSALVATLFEELKKLDLVLARCIIWIFNPETFDARLWMANSEDKKYTTSYFIKRLHHPYYDAIIKGWAEKKSKWIYELQGNDKKTIDELLLNETELTQLTDAVKAGIRAAEHTIVSGSFNNFGLIEASGPVEQTEEQLDIISRFGKVFDLTYTRFNDLKQAEHLAKQAQLDLENLMAEKKKTEEALTDLKAAQSQLIQSEKMASLGELTAGIAHEIQNPLNFVNNFSEVSKELLDEMKEAIEKGDTDEAKEIMNDVIQNLEKINHHGKRADGIVKGMLQHSRSSSNQKEPTDINALADEYLRLAYHGLRAKDKSFNATMKTDFDESIGNINIIPQDIGRVILNLITNAFYVVDEKKTLQQAQGDSSYQPTVTIATASIQPPSGGRSIQIKVSDNGGGIPQKVLDKIFQPFFTTKPTGQGTGLGLSLSYDIVKAHGGELKVETKGKVQHLLYNYQQLNKDYEINTKNTPLCFASLVYNRPAIPGGLHRLPA